MEHGRLHRPATVTGGQIAPYVSTALDTGTIKKFVGGLFAVIAAALFLMATGGFRRNTTRFSSRPTAATASGGRGHAGTIADRFDATVQVLSVVDSRNRFESPSSGLSADAWLEAERERAGRPSTRPSPSTRRRFGRGHTARGRPETELVDAVTEIPADLVVMGTHGRTGLDRYLLGSVAERSSANRRCRC